MFIKEMILSPEFRRYVVEKIKNPLLKDIIALALKYPEPEKGNTMNLNTHRLIDIRDKFLKYEGHPARKELFEAIWQMFIVEYEHDIYYRYRIDWVLEEIAKSGWVSRPKGEPEEKWWKEKV